MENSSFMTENKKFQAAHAIMWYESLRQLIYIQIY